VPLSLTGLVGAGLSLLDGEIYESRGTADFLIGGKVRFDLFRIRAVPVTLD